ncbi:MAG: ribose 5-phosphate isomerase B [Myxococcota bacterium]
MSKLKKIAIASDHAGFALKEILNAHLAQHFDLIDLGTDSTAPVDYPDFAEALALSVVSGQATRGILLCGSGVGASIAANKIKGIRAAVCHDTYSAHQGVEHDDMNVLVLGARIVGDALAKDLVDQFLSATFSNEARHVKRLKKIEALEAK